MTVSAPTHAKMAESVRMVLMNLLVFALVAIPADYATSVSPFPSGYPYIVMNILGVEGHIRDIFTYWFRYAANKPKTRIYNDEY